MKKNLTSWWTGENLLMYRCEPTDIEILKSLDNHNYGNRIFTSYEWVTFLKVNQNAKPVVLEIYDQQRLLGYFVGLVKKYLGFAILGSPFDGWFTPDMGFIWLQDHDIQKALEAVSQYAFKKLKCWYVQIKDKAITFSDLSPDTHYTVAKTLYLDLRQTEEEIRSKFSKSANNNTLNKLFKRGGYIKEVPLSLEVADQFYDQLVDVFAKQKLKPNYSRQKIHDMVASLQKKPEYVYALQVFSENHICVATSIYLKLNDWCYSIAFASYTAYQNLSPNEAHYWHGIKHLKEEGFTTLDLCGVRDWKLKFGPQMAEIPIILFYRNRALPHLKQGAENIVLAWRKIKGRISTTGKKK